jgi:hypothetical protein
VAIETGLEGKPWYYGLIVGLLVGGVIFGVTHYLLFGKMKQETARLEVRLGDLQTQIQEGLSAQRRLPQFREQVPRPSTRCACARCSTRTTSPASSR